MEQIAHGFSAARDITDGVAAIIETGQFSKFSKLLGKFAPFLGAYGAMFNIIGLFGNSPEVERLDQIIEILNEGFNRMEYRFDRIEQGFENLEDTIREEHFWTRLSPSLEKLSSAQERVTRYFKVTDPATRAVRQEDLDKDEYDKVFDALIAIRDTFEGSNGRDPLCELVTEYSDVDRRTVLRVATDLYNRMIVGAMNFVLIGKTLGRPDNDEDQEEMIQLLKDISKKINACDKDNKNNLWKKQWPKDLDIIIGDEKKGMP